AGGAYIGMDLIEGWSLAELIARGPLPVAEAVRIMTEIAAGLGAAHAVGVLHRDVKPANVRIEAQTGRVVLVDFGLAALAGAPRPRGRRPEVPEALEAIALRCLEKRPEARYRDAAALLLDLERLRRGRRVWSWPRLPDTLRRVRAGIARRPLRAVAAAAAVAA